MTNNLKPNNTYFCELCFIGDRRIFFCSGANLGDSSNVFFLSRLNNRPTVVEKKPATPLLNISVMRYVASKISNEPYKVNSFWVIFTQNLGMKMHRLAAGSASPQRQEATSPFFSAALSCFHPSMEWSPRPPPRACRSPWFTSC